MNCRERQEFFSDLYDGDLPPDRRRDLESHLSACAECRSEYEIFSASLHALRESVAPVPGEAFVRRVVESARGETERQALFQNTGLRRPTTRRMTAPRRALWTFPAIAASALVAFALGFFVQKHAADRDMEELIGKMSPQHTPVVPPPDRNTGPTPEEVVAKVLEDQNIVKAAGGLMSKEISERLLRGEMLVDGQWVDGKKFVEDRVKEELAKTPESPDQGAAEARVIEKFDLVKRGDLMIPRRWAGALDRGQVLDASGEPRALADLFGEKFRALGLVEHNGKWMSPEQRTELLAARRIQIPPGASASALTKALDGLEIGAPVGFRNLMLYPLISTGERALEVTTLADASAADRVEITEEVNPSALQLRVRNKGDVDLALFAGEILLGGRHGRVVARDTIVPAKKDRSIDVFDVEPAELRDKTAFRRESGHPWAPVGMRRLLNEETGQAGIWASAYAFGGSVATADLYREHRAALAEFRTAMLDLRSAHPGMVGVAAAVGESIAHVEVYGSQALFAAHFERVVDSAAIEAIVAGQRKTKYPSDLPAGPLSVKRLVESALSAESDVDADAIVVRRNGARILGRALTAGGDPVRVIFFPDGPVTARPPLDLAVAPAKVQQVLRAYEARLQSPGSPRRTATLREMAMLPGEQARKAVIAHANTGSPFRRDAVEALGLRGDPAVAEQLLKWLKESRRENPVVMYPVLAQALARIGSEEALQVLIADVDPKSREIARAAAEYIPLLMFSVRNQNALADAVGSLITAMNRMPPEAGSDPQGQWTLRTLRLVTGKSFAGTIDYTLWWNDAANRAEFLELRKRARE